jgi:tRNA U34 5-methylaminomethyl-2-thiouridine-forming methyltransferase MnmC
MALTYTEGAGNKDFQKLHETPWQVWNEIISQFSLYKDQVDLRQFQPLHNYDLIYFDAFAPSAQSELWTKEIFEKLFSCLEPGGLMVTYCVKGEVRRNMKAAGFEVEKIPGPPGKREMARAWKPQIPE